jgi:hypothetical protein
VTDLQLHSISCSYRDNPSSVSSGAAVKSFAVFAVLGRRYRIGGSGSFLRGSGSFLRGSGSFLRGSGSYLGHDLEGDVVGQTAVQLLVFSRRILDSFLGDSGPRFASIPAFLDRGGGISDLLSIVHFSCVRTLVIY